MNGRSSFIIEDAPQSHQPDKDPRSSFFAQEVSHGESPTRFRNEQTLKQQRRNTKQDRCGAEYSIDDLVRLLHPPFFSVVSSPPGQISRAYRARLNDPGVYSTQPQILPDR